MLENSFQNILQSYSNQNSEVLVSWNRTEILEINPHKNGHMIFAICDKATQ